jgi:hypothetical protein
MFINADNCSQTVVCSGSLHGSRRATGGFRRKCIVKIVSDIGRMRNTPVHVCANTAILVHLQKKLGELFIFITSCSSIIILENTLN